MRIIEWNAGFRKGAIQRLNFCLGTFLQKDKKKASETMEIASDAVLMYDYNPINRGFEGFLQNDAEHKLRSAYCVLDTTLCVVYFDHSAVQCVTQSYVIHPDIATYIRT